MANLAQQEQATDEEQRVIDKFNLSFNLCSVIPVINTFILDKCCFAAKADYDINNLADIQIALVLYIVLFYLSLMIDPPQCCHPFLYISI